MVLIVVSTMACAVACDDDGPSSPATVSRAVVEVTSQRCDQPNRFSGWGIRPDGASHGEIVTAAHVVDGGLRDLRVDGRLADVVLIDPRTDLAVVRERHPPTDAPTVRLATAAVSSATAGAAWLLTGGAEPQAIDVQRATRLLVDDVTTGRTYRRSAFVFSPAVPEGTSGAPIVDTDGDVLGIAVLSDSTAAISYATSADEVETVLEAAPAVPRPASSDCARVR